MRSWWNVKLAVGYLELITAWFLSGEIDEAEYASWRTRIIGGMSKFEKFLYRVFMRR